MAFGFLSFSESTFVRPAWENKAMQRQRGELVPIGEVVADLGGSVQALRETPPPAQRGFTLADQVNQLVSASEADPELGFMARTMALCSLPRSNPGNRLQYKRTNGRYMLGSRESSAYPDGTKDRSGHQLDALTKSVTPSECWVERAFLSVQ